MTGYDGDKVQTVMPEAARVVDPSGAGDSFNAGDLAARLAGAEPLQAAAAGHRLASTVISHHGAVIPREAMPKLQAAFRVPMGAVSERHGIKGSESRFKRALTIHPQRQTCPIEPVPPPRLCRQRNPIARLDQTAAWQLDDQRLGLADIDIGRHQLAQGFRQSRHRRAARPDRPDAGPDLGANARNGSVRGAGQNHVAR